MCFNADTGKLLWEYKFNLYQSDVPAHRVGWASPAADLETGTEFDFKGVVDLLSMKAFVFDGDSGKCSEVDIPAELNADALEWREKMLEDVSELDDGLLEKFLDGKELAVEELKKAVRG